jgi:hypothetical protein
VLQDINPLFLQENVVHIVFQFQIVMLPLCHRAVWLQDQFVNQELLQFSEDDAVGTVSPTTALLLDVHNPFVGQTRRWLWKMEAVVLSA